MVKEVYLKERLDTDLGRRTSRTFTPNFFSVLLSTDLPSSNEFLEDRPLQVHSNETAASQPEYTLCGRCETSDSSFRNY
jgi:hypothetical protein